MKVIDGAEFEHIDSVFGIDLSLTAPGIALIHEPWGSEAAPAQALTLKGLGPVRNRYASALSDYALRIVAEITSRALRSRGRIAVMEAVLNQSGTGKATERGALWWMVAAGLEAEGFAICTVHPTTRRSLAFDATGRALLAEERAKITGDSSLTPKEVALAKARMSRLAKKVGQQSQQRRWPKVEIPDDNAADALVCAELGARALGWAGLPELENKNLPKAIRALGITEKE